jgi:hypothetical protein
MHIKDGRDKIHIMYVDVHGRVDVTSIYVLGRMTCLHTEPLPFESNKTKDTYQTRELH